MKRKNFIFLLFLSVLCLLGISFFNGVKTNAITNVPTNSYLGELKIETFDIVSSGVKLFESNIIKYGLSYNEYNESNYFISSLNDSLDSSSFHFYWLYNFSNINGNGGSGDIIKSFNIVIDGVIVYTFRFIVDMTWGEFISSDYNEFNLITYNQYSAQFYYNSDFIITGASFNAPIISQSYIAYSNVSDFSTFKIYCISDPYTNSLVLFDTCSYQIGMTWRQFINSGMASSYGISYNSTTKGITTRAGYLVGVQLDDLIESMSYVGNSNTYYSNLGLLYKPAIFETELYGTYGYTMFFDSDFYNYSNLYNYFVANGSFFSAEGFYGYLLDYSVCTNSDNDVSTALISSSNSSNPSDYMLAVVKWNSDLDGFSYAFYPAYYCYTYDLSSVGSAVILGSESIGVFRSFDRYVYFKDPYTEVLTSSDSYSLSNDNFISLSLSESNFSDVEIKSYFETCINWDWFILKTSFSSGSHTLFLNINGLWFSASYVPSYPEGQQIVNVVFNPTLPNSSNGNYDFGLAELIPYVLYSYNLYEYSDSLSDEIKNQTDYYNSIIENNKTEYYDKGYNEGKDDGYNFGYNVGYNSGYSNGVLEGSDGEFTLRSLLGTIFTFPLQIMTEGLNVELWGINVGGLLMFFFAIAIVLIIIRLVFKFFGR